MKPNYTLLGTSWDSFHQPFFFFPFCFSIYFSIQSPPRFLTPHNLSYGHNRSRNKGGESSLLWGKCCLLPVATSSECLLYPYSNLHQLAVLTKPEVRHQNPETSWNGTKSIIYHARKKNKKGWRMSAFPSRSCRWQGEDGAGRGLAAGPSTVPTQRQEPSLPLGGLGFRAPGAFLLRVPPSQ